MWLISENLQHGLVGLLLAEKFGAVIAVLVLVYYDMLRGRLQAVLDSAVAGNGLLICTRMEKPMYSGSSLSSIIGR